MNLDPPTPQDHSPDHDDRIQDFYARHGGASDQPSAQGVSAGGLAGWSEIYAKDGYRLRCDWSRSGNLEEMKYSELRPAS